MVEQIGRQNLVGPQVARLRSARGWSQDELAGHLQRLGWDISRGTLAKIEARIRCVTDRELLWLARALKARLDDLYPAARRW